MRKAETEVLVISDARFRITLTPDAVGWRAECTNPPLGAWGEDRTTARSKLSEAIQREINQATVNSQMDALTKAIGYHRRGKVRGAHKFRRD